MGVTIALDAMGGDRAPSEIVRGAIDAAGRDDGPERILLVGRRRDIDAQLESRGIPPGGNGVLELRDASQVVEMDEAPALALRRKRDSSIKVSTRLLASGEADALVTAGNTGAAVVASWLVLERAEGIDRPALAAFLPAGNGYCVMVDAGANVDCSPGQLVQFALMGSDCVRTYLGLDRPRVGILSNGEEKGKGNSVTVEAAEILEELGRRGGVRFVGNVEGREIPRGVVDVLVTDGFVGNIVLKTAEGAVQEVFRALKESLSEGWAQRLALALLAPSLKGLKRRYGHSSYGGAMLLGVKAPVIVAHGSSEGESISSAIKLACSCVACKRGQAPNEHTLPLNNVQKGPGPFCTPRSDGSGKT
ncbi:MAG: phosphate acyltransferase PlsX [Actinobacteria bacterium]|nr:phosphate acyltransferase PlsX [Actinomycetota bacterium]MCG2817781.1 phosphate acyltransferase PlsX [Actinomycetes bacterium]MBU4359648.1 phosphate acyltransferase PlsX [Actinomycetota bacterium]MBU4391905.1 phosphate acyltransferase PlsX [Actinomycetota bacterium]MBU4403466.1 phosphate acyltransferase PlsX [Actinomycetota bacterium]